MLYFFLVLWGWLNIYAAVYSPDAPSSLFDFSINSGKQLLWIITALLLLGFIMIIDYRFFESFAFGIYGIFILMLVSVLIFGKEVAGSKSWFEIGSIRIQPAEFAKFATSLAMASVLSSSTIKLDQWRSYLRIGAVLAAPAILILLQNDTGSTLVFSSFVLVLYREGLNPAVLVLGIACIVLFILALLVNKFYIMAVLVVLGVAFIVFNKSVRSKFRSVVVVSVLVVLASLFVYSVDYFVTNILQPHQQNRIKALVNPDADPLGYGWNVTQSKIAIGSGGFWGKGFLEGTQTKFDFVPEQHTDFIFCTIGEEWGWLGSLVLIATFVVFFLRLIYLAERQRSKFARIYGYCVLGIMLFHFTINIGMTIGLLPVIGIPLPFFSYGGSSLWSFTMLLFVFVNLDSNRKHILA